MRHRFQVQHHTLCDGWICFGTVEVDGVSEEETFPTLKEAMLELYDFFETIKFDIDAGVREPDHGYSMDEFRIFDLWTEQECVLDWEHHGINIKEILTDD